MFVDGFEKTAFLKVEHLEDALGVHFDKKLEQAAEKEIAHQKGKRLGLRHPILTGIPTLGMWPSISHSSALQESQRRMLRSNPGLRRAVDKAERKAERAAEAAHKREVALMEKHIADRNAESRERMLATGVVGGLSALNTWARNKRQERNEDEF